MLHTYVGEGQSSLPSLLIQMGVSSEKTFVDNLELVFYQLYGHPLAQLSWHMTLTITDGIGSSEHHTILGYTHIPLAWRRLHSFHSCSKGFFFLRPKSASPLNERDISSLGLCQVLLASPSGLTFRTLREQTKQFFSLLLYLRKSCFVFIFRCSTVGFSIPSRKTF